MASRDRLFVGNIPFAICNYKNVRELFEQIGGVHWVEVPFPHGKPGGFAFITMENETDNSRAIERFNGYSSHGRSITVELETPVTAEPSKKDKYTDTQKWCAFCERMLPHREFAQNVTQPHGLMSWCRECNAVHRAVHRAARADGVSYADVRHNPERVAALREAVRARVRGAGEVHATTSANAPGVVSPDIQTLATNLLLPASFLKDTQMLLDEKKQVIFQGPPGTGKTYVARALAEHLAGSEERVTLVQFHPSYAYEDFVQGFRPALLDNGQPGFRLVDGPLVQAANRASEEQRRADEAGEEPAKHFIVIDEINRGNLGKIFGELYFLLEYRDDEICLQYSDEPFSLPENLYVIGTMNTADRSIALVDLALRRRFSFVEFHVRDEKGPVKGLLRRWLKANGLGHMEWVADIVDRANEKLDDRHAAVGPSYFMKPGLTEERARRIWKHDVLPYIEERLYGESGRLGEFDFDKLRSGGAGESTAEEQGEAGDEDGGEGDASA